MTDIMITVADDYDSLVEFFIANELEFSDDDPVPTDLVRCWKAETADGKLAGASVLAKREGEYIIDGIAVDEKYRNEDLGSRLLDKAVEEIRSRGGSRLYLVARAPGFFRTRGFKSIPGENAPDFFECLTCPQFGRNCHPEIMELEV